MRYLLAALLCLITTYAVAQVRLPMPANVVINPDLYQDLKWRSVGPHRGGRSTAVAGVRTQPNVFYMGATGGGVWKTENYGITWVPVSDGQIATGSIGAIDVSDSNPNVVYVGTGSEAIRSNVILGRGVYKSIDAGKTWQLTGLENAGQIGQLKIHPKNPDIAYVAAVGNPFAWGFERGVYRTKDGGKSWQKVLSISNETGAVSIAINWSKPDEVYAGAWRAQRRPWTIISGGPASEGGIYKTTDGGDHWSHLTSGLPTNLIGKVWLDIAQSNPKIVYAFLEAPDKEGGLYRSDDQGGTWKLVNNDPRLRARPFYFNKMFVNPTDENDLWVTELGFHHSTDGGKTWTTVSTPHGDNHVVWINPDNPKIFIESNDGGANVTQDGGRSWSSIFNQPTGELYMVDVDNQFPYRLYGPQQDNSTVAVYNVPPFAWGADNPMQTWTQASGCESGQIRATPDGKIVYGDCKGEFGRYDVDTGQEQHYWISPEQRYGKDPKDMTYRFVRQAPIEIDPFNPKVVYHGSQYLHRTTDGGIHWEKISPDVTANGPDAQLHGGEPITRDVTGEEVYAALYAIRASRSEPGVIWTGANDGLVWLTRDGGKSWKNVTPKDLPPGGRVHTIEDSPHRKGSAYVSVYRIYFGDFKPYLYMTNDYGEHWTLLTDGRNGIPEDHPMHVVREDPQQEGLLYAGTWYGAFVSFDQGQHWQSLQQNLPATAVTDIFVKDDDLVISTMGRAFWIMDDIAPLRQLAASMLELKRPVILPRTRSRTGETIAAPRGKAMRTPGTRSPLPPLRPIKPWQPSSNVFLFTPAPTYRTHYAAAQGRPDWPEFPPVGARIDYALSGPAAEIRLEIVDSSGKVVRSYSSAGGSATQQQGRGGGGRRGGGLPATLPKKSGINRFIWDLRYPGGAASGGGGEEGGFSGAGPLAPPGTYQARLTANGETKTEPIVVKIDPRYAKDGLTVADLVEQTRFALQVRDSLAEGRRLGGRVKQAIDRGAGNQSQLETLYYKIVNRPGPYPANMLVEQFSNIAREIGQADQQVGAGAYERYNDLLKELAAIKGEIDQIIGPAP
jgi:photosystem II stability/assembly factor-like uncharacterized protein